MRLKPFTISSRMMVRCLLVIMFVFFFVGGPDYHSSRHYFAIWNLGHILFFTLLSYEIFQRGKWFAGRFAGQGAAVLGLCLGLGILVEILQSGLHRIPDAGDVVRDVVGGLVGIFFLLDTRKVLWKKVLTVFQTITIGLVVLQVYPVFAYLADEHLAHEQFPVLSGFETPWELTRWEGSAAFDIDKKVHSGGKRSLKVQLGTDHYSGVHLKYFPGNWNGAKRFRCRVYNPLNDALFLTIRINDMRHRRGRQRYEDRFNRLYELPAGWTTIDIDAADIRCAPKGRRMDMGHIEGLAIFAMDLPEPRVIYIDDVRLVF